MGEHLPAAQLLHMVGGVLLLVGQRDPALEELGAEELHEAGQLLAQLGSAGVVLALAAGGQVQHELLVQGEISQRLPREGGHAGADGGILPAALLAAQPEGVIVGVGQRGVPLHLFGRGHDAARAADRDAEAAVGAGVPVLDEVGAGEDGVAVGADVLAVGAGGAVGVEVPTLTADHLGMGGLHQGIHGIAGKQTHSGITPFRGHRSRW